MRLFLVELTRFRSRRAIVLMLVAAALLTAVVAATTIWDTRPITAEDRAAAQAQVDQMAQEPWAKKEIARCEKNPERYSGDGATAEDCRQMFVPAPEDLVYRETLSLGRAMEGPGMGVLVIVAALMTIVGTTFAGGDWASGSMSNQLLFEPRRLKLWLAKAAAVFVGAVVVSAVLVSAFWVTLYVVAESRGIATGATVQEQIRWFAGRGVLLSGLVAVGAYALTMLLRHTVGTLAVLFAYVVGGEILIQSLPIEGSLRWSLAHNAAAWIQDGYKYWDSTITCSPMGECDQEAFLSLTHGATYLGVLLAVAVVLSVAFFRRRDIP
ncbi:MAG: hypothetical protein ACRDPJ_16570 [Nocardioidaceae bacterium]